MAAPPIRSVSLIIPVYNERDNLEPLLAESRQVLDRAGLRWEIVLVNDGSDDGSAELLDQMAAREPEVRVVHLAANAGQTAAFAAGFRCARGEAVVTMDADLQNDPADIPALLAALPGHGAVVGWRRGRQDDWVRRLSSRIANGVRNRVTRETVRDTGCSLKAFRREALEDLPLTQGMHRFLPTLIRMRGYRVAELPVSHRPRHAGRSKYGIGNRLFVGLGDLLMVRWMQKRALHYRVARTAGRGLPAGEREEASR